MQAGRHSHWLQGKAMMLKPSLLYLSYLQAGEGIKG
jgi:hypothetical protein